MTTTDFLIVGAGPSGTAAAISLAKQGKDCLLVDKATFPRVKLCGGLFTGKSQGALMSLIGAEAYGECMARCMTNTERKFSLWRTTPTERKCLVQVTPRKEIVLIDRPRFDEWMLRHYESLGGRLAQGDGIVSIDFAHRTAQLASGKRIAYGTLIAADGANSTVERLLVGNEKAEARGNCNMSSAICNGNSPTTSALRNGNSPTTSAIRNGNSSTTSALRNWNPTRGNSLCLEINVDRADCPTADGIQIHFGVVPHSYAWSFAKGDKVCLGLVKLNGTHTHIQPIFRQFLRSLQLRNADRYPLRGAMIPFGNYMPHPASHRHHILFAGDAARLVEPLTGEGIYYALQSGIYAAQSEGDATRYLGNIAYLHQLIDKGARYQRWLMTTPLHPLMCSQAHKHPSFIEHFYSTQIEQACLDSFLKILWKYKKGK